MCIVSLIKEVRIGLDATGYVRFFSTNLLQIDISCKNRSFNALLMSPINILLQDEFSSLPPIVPNGPIAIYGLVRTENYSTNVDNISKCTRWMWNMLHLSVVWLLLCNWFFRVVEQLQDWCLSCGLLYSLKVGKLMKLYVCYLDTIFRYFSGGIYMENLEFTVIYFVDSSWLRKQESILDYLS